jgi:hypothetical protein
MTAAVNQGWQYRRLVTARMLYLIFVCLTDWLDGAAGGFGGVEGCRVAGAAPRGRGAAAAELQARAGLGRPRHIWLGQGSEKTCPFDYERALDALATVRIRAVYQRG